MCTWVSTLSKQVKFFILPILGILIGIEPKLFIIPFDFIFDIQGTHLSLGGWLSLLFLVLAVFYDLFLFVYLLKHNKTNRNLVWIAAIFLFFQFALSGWEIGFWH
jgi:hypothetical protein